MKNVMAKLGGSKQKKMNSRVDFTPMVDMIMLLVTFFMLCTTLLKPQTMDITMPSDKDDIKEENKSQVAADKALTVILDKEDAVYYFTGKPSEADLKKTTFGRSGIRRVIMDLNLEAVEKAQALKKEFQSRYSSDPKQDAINKEEYKKRLSDIKNADTTVSVIIKATDDATYQNLLSILDEMSICSVGKFVIDKVQPQDESMIAELEGK